MHYSSTDKKERWIDDYIERETAAVRIRFEDTETATKQGHQDVQSANWAGLTTREPGKMFDEMLDTIRDSLSDLASSDDEEDGENDDQDTDLGKLSENDEPSWLMGTISKTVKQHVERFQ